MRGAYYNYSCVRISLLDQGFRDSLAPAGDSLSTSFNATENTAEGHYYTSVLLVNSQLVCLLPVGNFKRIVSLSLSSTLAN